MLTSPRPRCWGLFQHCLCLLPTWRGWLVLLLGAALIVIVLGRGMLPFLAVTDSKPGGLLVVEGWVPDYALVAAIEEFHRHPYRRLLIAGGPIEKGAPFSEFGTLAELGAATVQKLDGTGIPVQAVPAADVLRDRTYASAVAVREWLRQHDEVTGPINVLSLGPHARRTRLAYAAAFGDETEIGIIALEDRSFDARRWWASSQGFRTVVSEVIAYLYERLLFRKTRETARVANDLAPSELERLAGGNAFPPAALFCALFCAESLPARR